VAGSDDILALQALIERSARALSVGYYSAEQIDSLMRYVFGVDTQLIADGTFFLIESDTGALRACGGWSRRATLYGGDQAKRGPDPLLDPAIDPARIRAFFVAPEAVRQGLGLWLLETCIDAAKDAGFTAVTLAATLPGVPLYTRFGFAALAPIENILPDGVTVSYVPMLRAIAS
jgi:GNAT superfamily N-acetyltransferase